MTVQQMIDRLRQIRPSLEVIIESPGGNITFRPVDIYQYLAGDVVLIETEDT